jgi:hypothetical protein
VRHDIAASMGARDAHEEGFRGWTAPRRSFRPRSMHARRRALELA